MKKIFVLLFSLLISYSVYSEWIEVVTNDVGDIFYIDEKSIRKHNEYNYYWILANFLEPIKSGSASYFSSIVYYKGDCGIFRHKVLDSEFYEKPMGTGKSVNGGNTEEWAYSQPGSSSGIILNYACKFKEK